MSLISRIEISNYLTEGLDKNRQFADWNPLLHGITLRMDGRSALINITNGAGKTSMAELLLYLLSRDRTLLSNLRDKTAPKGRGYTHARIEFRRINEDTSYREPSLLEIDVDNLPGETYVIGVALNNDVADPPIFYGYSGTFEDSPCYTKENGQLLAVPDGDFVKRTRAMPQSKWDKFSSAREWQGFVGDFISMDVVLRNAAYQAKGSDDKNASFFGFKPRNGESYDSAFFKAVIAPDLLTNLLNSFSEENENSIEDTLHISLSHIVKSEREIARKQANLERRSTAIQVDLKPVVDAGVKANKLHSDMQTALRSVKKDVALLHHFGSQKSSYKVPGLPHAVSSLPDHEGQDPRVRRAIKDMVISREDGILIRDKALSDLTGVEVRRIGEIADRKRITHATLNSQVIDFACDFEVLTSGSVKGGHYRNGYSRQSVAQLLPLLAGTQGATLDGLDDVFEMAFNIAESQIETNPASLKILALESSLLLNTQEAEKLCAQSEELAGVIEGMELQIKGREENEEAWKAFSSMAINLPEDVRATPKQARDWIVDRAKRIQNELAALHSRHGGLKDAWQAYQTALDEAGLEGIVGIRGQLDQLTSENKKISEKIKTLQTNLDELTRQTAKMERDVGAENTVLAQCSAELSRLDELKAGHTIFQGYFGDVDPTTIEDPIQSRDNIQRRKSTADDALRTTSAEWDNLCSLSAKSSRFSEIFGADTDPLTCAPVLEHRQWTAKANIAMQEKQRLEPLVAALESFVLKFPDDTPSDWIKAADSRREALESAKREITAKRNAIEYEIDALDRLSLVDDDLFAQAWERLGNEQIGGERLFSFLQGVALPLENRVAALSALSGLLSAPVFASLAEMEAASTLLEQNHITIPLLLKEPLLQAVQSQVDMAGELRLIGFFAGRYSRKVRILLEPEYAVKERALLVQKQVALQQQLDEITNELPLVDFKHEFYVIAQNAVKAVESSSVDKFKQYEREYAEAEAQLHRLVPQIKDDALECLAAKQNFLKKGGDEKQRNLFAECEALRQKINDIKDELEGAQKRASPESVKAYFSALEYAKKGAEIAHESVRNKHANATEALAFAKGALGNHNEQIALHKGELEDANVEAQTFNDKSGPARINNLQSVLKFADKADDVLFMQSFAQQSADKTAESSRLTSFQAQVNFDRAAAYVENLGKSETDMVNEISAKKAAYSGIADKIKALSTKNSEIKNFEIPNWAALRKAIHDFAYEVGSLAAKTKKAHAELHELEEGMPPAEAHPMYVDIDALNMRIKSTSFEETTVLASLLVEETFKLKELNPQAATEAFFVLQRDYKAAHADYCAKNQSFCEVARKDAGTKMAAFNALELDEIEKSTPAQIATLSDLFDRLNLSLKKDRDDANKAIQAAHHANETALTNLSRLIEVAEDNLGALKKVMSRYENGCFKIKVQLAGGELIKEILNELKENIKRASVESEDTTRTLRRSDETKIKQILRETIIDKVFLEPQVTFIHSGIRNKESFVTDKLSTGQKVALEFMWIVRQAEYEIERGLREMSSKQAARERVKRKRAIFVDGIFSTLSDREIIRDAFSGLNSLGGNFQIIGFLHSPTWTNDYSVFPVYHVGKKLTNSTGSRLVAFSEEGRDGGTLGFFSSIGHVHENAA